MVTFEIDAIPDQLVGLRSPAGLELPPYENRAAMLTRGATGELIELVVRD